MRFRRLRNRNGHKLSSFAFMLDDSAGSRPACSLLILSSSFVRSVFNQAWSHTMKTSMKLAVAVWTPPDAKHWHGATRASSMTHAGVSESEEGSSVTWLEPVSDAQYQGN